MGSGVPHDSGSTWNSEVLLAFLYFRNRPGGVFGDERFGVGGGFHQSGEGAGIAGVAEGDADVAEEAAAFGAEDGGVGEALFESGGVEGEEFEEVGGGEVGAGVGAQE